LIQQRHETGSVWTVMGDLDDEKLKTFQFYCRRTFSLTQDDNAGPMFAQLVLGVKAPSGQPQHYQPVFDFFTA